MRLSRSSTGARRGPVGLPSISVSTTAFRRRKTKSFTVLKAALRVGGDNHLAVLLEPYAPTVRCEGFDGPLSRESCAKIELDMDADDEPRLFGDESRDPAVDEPLPYTMLAREFFNLPTPLRSSFG